jgi:hypothetical protein
MLELDHDQLIFSFPEVHPEAVLKIEFQRTLRIPDDGRTYPLPPGLGRFSLVHVDDYAERVPAEWSRHGGLIMPMYQAEALWLYFTPEHNFRRRSAYPFAIKVFTGKIDAVTGQQFSHGLHERPQDYLVSPSQPWLDGYCVKKGTIRQFVAMPLGKGFTAEEQITGSAEWGGLQIVVYPMKAEEYERRYPEVEMLRRVKHMCMSAPSAPPPCSKKEFEMGLAPGGKMKQEIFKDSFGLRVWDKESCSRCFVHIANSQAWLHITGRRPPNPPPTAVQYTSYGYPWFDYYGGDLQVLGGAPVLSNLKSVANMELRREVRVLPENESCSPSRIHRLKSGAKSKLVREGEFWDESI